MWAGSPRAARVQHNAHGRARRLDRGGQFTLIPPPREVGQRGDLPAWPGVNLELILDGRAIVQDFEDPDEKVSYGLGSWFRSVWTRSWPLPRAAAVPTAGSGRGGWRCLAPNPN